MATNDPHMPRERDTESGKYVEQYPPERFVEAVRDADGMASTQAVADALGCSYDLAYKRLRALSENGKIDSQRVANARLWIAREVPA
jgi:hypothetical protein